MPSPPGGTAKMKVQLRYFTGASMKTVKFTSWQDGDFFIGFLNEYPDYQTQALSKEELTENLKDFLVDLESSQVPFR